ncbi:CBS domain-containing protein [Streptomyces sp. SAI-126]|jgi:CBS domain-containing protein|uniref:CBS domain-containing protein n=2 Tax=Streptomyces TaxID=1883 RepID=UPI000FC1BD27|nr:CBS domain-containing protein [Streptomyces sp. A2-16]QUC59995.1 CBS domain-containing protein [Streptomyces sp. A2-16]
MDDRDAREGAAASAEARHAVPLYARKPVEEFRQTMMVRYLQAVASHAAQAAAEEPADAVAAQRATPSRPAAQADTIADLQVRHVMKRSVTGVTADTPFLDVARMLARQQIGAVPVVDGSQHVLGVIAESDLLARAADLSAPGGHAGPLSRLLGRHHDVGEAGGTAGTLMSAPALTVRPWTPVVEAARTAAGSRIRQIFVTDHHERLVGVVSRSELLHALVRDDRAIRDEIVSHVIRNRLGLAPGEVEVRVRNGTVTLTGTIDRELISRLTAEVAAIPDVYEVDDHLIAH